LSASPLFTLAVPSSSVRTAAAIVGAPFDLTASFRRGSREGPSAIRRLSESLETYSPVLERDLEDLVIVDLGDAVPATAPVGQALDAIERAMGNALSIAQVAVLLGGEHTVTLAGYRAVRRVYPDAVLVQVDAHADLRAEWEGEAITHASWLNQVGVEFGFESIFQFGIRSLAREEAAVRRRLGWHSSELLMPTEIADRLCGQPVYLTIDIDVLDPGAAPGTGSPEPGGASFRELADFFYALAPCNVVAFDIVEVAPNLDPSEVTAAAAAKLVREGVLLFGGEDREALSLAS
jgi:agmatinase